MPCGMFFTSQWLWVHHIVEHFTLTIRLSLLRVWPTATWDQVTSLPTGGCRIPTLSSRRRGWAWGRALTTADVSLSAVSQFAAALPDSESAVNVEGVRLEAVLCCTAGRDCEPCLQVIITIRGGGLAQTTAYVKGVCLAHGVLATIHLCFIAAFLCGCTCPSAFIAVLIDRSLTGSVFSFRNLYSQSFSSGD